MALELLSPQPKKSGKAVSLESTQGSAIFFLNCRKAASLLRGQLGVPHIHNEDQPER